jgi:hypothetical protein
LCFSIKNRLPYQAYCRRCEVYFYEVERFCRRCGMTMRTSPTIKNKQIYHSCGLRVLLCPLYHHIPVCFQIQFPYEINQVSYFHIISCCFSFSITSQISICICLVSHGSIFHSDQLPSSYKPRQKPQPQAVTRRVK